MFSKTIMTTLTVSIISTSMLAPIRALAESVSGTTTVIQRGADGVADHRSTAPNDAVVRDQRTTTASDETVRDHRTKTTTRDHRTERDNEVVPVVDYKKDCRVGASKLFKMGYRSIHAVDCSGNIYHYVAMDEAALFTAEMNAYSGEINVIFVGITG